MSKNSTSFARRVGVVGSGSWGTAITGLIAPQAEQVVVWSYEHDVAQGINERHRNPHQLILLFLNSLQN